MTDIPLGAPTPVQFRPPGIGNTQVPIKLTGEGSVTLTEEGLIATGKKVAGFGRGLLLIAAFLGCATVVALLDQHFEFPSIVRYALAGSIGLAILPFFRRPAREGEPMSLSIPWSNIKKVAWDGTSQCLMIVVRRMKPKGALYIVAPNGSPLEQAIRERLS